jgi:hypothetical protein
LDDLSKQLSDFIQADRARRADSWRIDVGEEAKVDCGGEISTMFQLSNGLIAVAAKSSS